MRFIDGLIVTILFSTVINAGTKSVNVIYGDDNRKDLHENVSQKHLDWARATAAMVDGDSLEKIPGTDEYSVGEDILKDNVCADEKFVEQPTLANCSGFLVGENLLVTAGHCITDKDDCNSYKWIFDYSTDPETGKIRKIVDKNIYSCKRIVSRELVSRDRIMLRRGKSVSKEALTPFADEEKGVDFALIELDRKVKKRTPLKFRKKARGGLFGNKTLKKGMKLVMIGHPSGLPTKVAAGAEVMKIEKGYFIANLDAFGGNSGSAVINDNTGEVEGILVRGRDDYDYDYAGDCYKPNTLDHLPEDEDAQGYLGEESTLITQVKKLK